MVILTQFAFGQNISVEDIEREGITKIDIADITGAKRLGYQIKLLGRAKLFNGHIAISVSPTLIPQNQVLANIQNENNAVFVTGASVGETMFYGPGAGELPTANSVLSDIISVGKNILANRIGNSFNSYQAHVPLADSSEIIDPYYLSLEVDDIPGQLLKITEIMNNANASFNVLIQDELPNNRARIMMITHSMSKSQLTEVKNNLSSVANLNIKAAFRVLK